MRRVFSILGATALVGLSFAPPTAAHEGETEHERAGDEVPSGATFLTPEEALAEDMAFLAEKTGDTVEEVREGVEHQERFDGFLIAVGERYPDIFAGAWTDGFPRSTSTVRVWGEVPDDLAAVSATLGAQGYAEAVTAVSARDNRVEVVVPHTAERGLSQADEVRTEVLERITVAFRARPSSSATEG